MLVEINPGSRQKQCDICGSQWVERRNGVFFPNMDLKVAKFYLPTLCRECRELHDIFVRRHVARPLWREFGVEESNEN